MPAISKSHGINTGIWIWQSGQRHFPPGLASIFGPDFKIFPLPGATERLQFARRMEQDGGLNGGDSFAVIYRRGRLLGLGQVSAAFEMYAPTGLFRAAGR